MQRIAFLLRPQWLVLYVVVIAFAYLCFTVLAPWQLGKNTRTSRENAQISASVNAPPVPVTSVLPHRDSTAPGSQWRQVSATGRYHRDAQVLARLRVIDGDPAYEVLVPFTVDGGPTVLVDRGYVRPVQGADVPPIPPAPDATVTIVGRLRDPEPAAPGKLPFREGGALQVYSIDPAQVAAVTGLPSAGSYLQLIDGQPGGLGVIPLPHLDSGPFLSYGIQWIAFGIVAPLGVGYFAYAELAQRRRERAAEPPPSAPRTVEDKLADRYGRRR